MITAALPGHQSEPAARECLRRTGAAQMNYRGQLLPLLTAEFRFSMMPENCGEVAVQEHRREFGGVAGTTREWSRVAEQPVSTTEW